MKISLAGPTYQSISPNVDCEWAMNVYCERSESSGAKSPIALLKVPGKSLAYALPEASVPGLFTVNGRNFAACSNLYELLPNGKFTNLGSLGASPTGPTQILANQTQLLILNNGNLYVLTLSNNAFAAVTMSQLGGAGSVLQIGFADGYGIAVLVNSHTWQQSNLEDFTTWGGLNIATVSYFPDNIVSMVCDHRELWMFSAKKSLGYYNAGAGFPVFIPIQGAFLEDGAAATWATVQLDNSLFWLSRDERGALIAKRLNGYAGQRISTHAVEEAWQAYSRADDAVAFTYQENGHGFWVIRFPTANATWVYDVATNYWHQRAFWSNAQFIADRATSHTYDGTRHLVGDPFSGNIYQLSSALQDDNGLPLRWVRRVYTPSPENSWLYFSEFEADMDTGAGGNIMFRWSNDAAQTWGNQRIISMGQLGQYSHRVRKTMLGRARRRVWEISGTDPVPIRIADAYVQAEGEA